MRTHTTPNTPIRRSHKPPNMVPSSPAPRRTGQTSPSTKKHTSLTNVQFTHKQEFMWRVHNTRLLSHNPTLRYPMLGQFANNNHMAVNCLSMSGVRQDRHNSAIQLLLSLMEHHNGGRWKTITANFGNKPIKSFTSTTPIHNPLDCHPPHPTHMPTRLVVAAEGLSPGSLTVCPAILPEDIPP
jgi:hypothetical protein